MNGVAEYRWTIYRRPESAGPVPQHRHAKRFKRFDSRRQIQKHLSATTDHGDGRTRKSQEIGRNVWWLVPATTLMPVDPAQSTSGKYLDPGLGRECNACGYGGCTIRAAGGHRRNVSNAAFLNVFTARNEFDHFVVKSDANLASHNRDHCWHSSFTAYRFVQRSCDRHTFGIGKTVRDDCGFEGYDGRIFGKRLSDFSCNL